MVQNIKKYTVITGASSGIVVIPIKTLHGSALSNGWKIQVCQLKKYNIMLNYEQKVTPLENSPIEYSKKITSYLLT